MLNRPPTMLLDEAAHVEPLGDADRRLSLENPLY
jgi:hypothetical protein